MGRATDDGDGRGHDGPRDQILLSTTSRWRKRVELRAGFDELTITAQPLVASLRVPWLDVAGAAPLPPSPFEREVYSPRPVRILALMTPKRAAPNLLLMFQSPQAVRVVRRRRRRSRVDELVIDGVSLHASEDSGAVEVLAGAGLGRRADPSGGRGARRSRCGGRGP